MPPVRKEDFLHEYNGDPKMFICDICTNWHIPNTVTETVFCRTSKSKHLQSMKHIKADERMRNNAQDIDVMQVDEMDFIPVDLPIFDHFEPVEYNQQPTSVRTRSVEEDFYQNGKELVFSAGEYSGISQQIVESETLDKEFEDLDEFDGPMFEISEDLPANIELDADSIDTDGMGNRIPDGFDFLSDESRPDDEWFPYETKTLFMLDLIDNLPRLKISNDLMKAILWVMRECGTPDIPTFYELRKKQESLAKQFVVPTTHHESPMQNHFYMNHPKALLSLDWSNPLVRPLINLYPEVKGPIRETWQAEKWTKDAKDDELSPMWADWKHPGRIHRHYFVHELAYTIEKKFVLIKRWITIQGIESAEIWDVDHNEDSDEFHIPTNGTRYIPAADLRLNIHDILKHTPQLCFSPSSPQFDMPNKLREVTKGRPMFRIRMTPWSDDVSGNVSKQYNAHMNCCIINMNIPHRYLSQEYFIRFCSTSQYASSSELFVALSQDFQPEKWFEAYDCLLEREILFQILPHFLPADNPQQSETSSHIGVKANYNSRRDNIGGNEAHKESDEIYLALYKPGKPRNVEETLKVIELQVRTACTGNESDVLKHYSSTGVKDKIAHYWICRALIKARELKRERLANIPSRNVDMRRRIEKEIEDEVWRWVVAQPSWSFEQLDENDPARTKLRAGDHYNILLSTRGLDVHRDTPIEILHTYLLGNDKYVWYDMSKNWQKNKEEIFADRLQSASIDGLSVDNTHAQYIVKYKNNLIGKHFRILQQLAIFSIHDDLANPGLFNLWKASGELGALLWYPEIDDMEQYLTDLQILIDNLLDVWGQYDPRRIISKIKLRLLPYLADDIRRFGPAVLFETELFECFNRVFRLSSIYSNHQAPSRDIALDMAHMERIRHIVSGGWWKDSDGKYVHAAKGVRDLLEQSEDLQRRLGWRVSQPLEIGSVKQSLKAGEKTLQWEDTRANVVAMPPDSSISGQWYSCEYVVSHSQDICREGSWVFFRLRSVSAIGRILQILTSVSPDPRHSWIVIETYDVNAERDARLNMPIMMPSNMGVVVAKPEDISFLFNAQHDCFTTSCSLTTDDHGQFYQQERVNTTVQKRLIKHSSVKRYIINMHALHNAHLLRKALPRHLTQPTPLYATPDDERKKLASNLRITGREKRLATQEKSKATRQRNKELQDARNQTQSARE